MSAARKLQANHTRPGRPLRGQARLDAIVAGFKGSEDAVKPQDQEDDATSVRKFTGWKLDLCRAVRADHKVPPGPSSLFAAFMDHVNHETKRAWPSEGMLAIALGVNRKTIRKYLQVLLDAKWMKAVGRSKRGTTIYEVQDYRMNAVLDQLAIDIDRFRESEALRQSKRRSRRANVCPPLGTPVERMSVHMGSGLSVPPYGHEHLQGTPSDITSSEEGNNYRRVSDGW